MEEAGGGRFKSSSSMSETKNMTGWGDQGQLKNRRRLTKPTTTMPWDRTEFLVSIKIRIDGRVCNALLIFIAPPYPSLFSPSSAVTVNVNVPCSLDRTAAKDDAMLVAGEHLERGRQ